VRVTAAATAPAGAPAAPGVADWQSAARTVLGVAGVAGVAPYAELQALAVRRPEMLPVVLRGIDPRAAGSATRAGARPSPGTARGSDCRLRRIIVGEVIARAAGIGAR